MIRKRSEWVYRRGRMVRRRETPLFWRLASACLSLARGLRRRRLRRWVKVELEREPEGKADRSAERLEAQRKA